MNEFCLLTWRGWQRAVCHFVSWHLCKQTGAHGAKHTGIWVTLWKALICHANPPCKDEHHLASSRGDAPLNEWATLLVFICSLWVCACVEDQACWLSHKDVCTYCQQPLFFFWDDSSSLHLFSFLLSSLDMPLWLDLINMWPGRFYLPDQVMRMSCFGFGFQTVECEELDHCDALINGLWHSYTHAKDEKEGDDLKDWRALEIKAVSGNC